MVVAWKFSLSWGSKLSSLSGCKPSDEAFLSDRNSSLYHEGTLNDIGLQLSRIEDSEGELLDNSSC